LFLAGLSRRGREGFAVLAHELVHADGRLSSEEQTILDRLRSEAGDLDQSGGGMGFDDAVASIVDPLQRRAAFIECIGICWSDGMIADEEAVLLDQIADAWSIDAADRSAMIDWVKRQADLVADAQTLIGAVG
jgi:uncharacterized tellurite resistance protein B-like protein